MTAYFEAMRLGRWPRSLAIFVGTTAYFFLHYESFASLSPLDIYLRCAGAFLLTWAISTANYIINEIADAPYDAHHPTKRNRPLVRGEIHKGLFLLMGLVLSASALLLSWRYFSRPFFFALLALWIAGFIYNIRPVRTKDIPFLDSISESANNPIRFLIGWFAFAPTNLFPPWSLLLCWWSFGNFLMVAKRLSEFRLLQDKAGDYRRSLGRYSRRSLLLGLAFSAVVFFVTYFLFAVSTRLESFLFLSPLVLIYFFIFFRKTLKEREVMEEPEQLLKHPAFAAYTLFMVLAYFVAFFLDTAYR
ncbi:UbiA family prenyltransferase [Acidobacteriota bacterium]